MHITDIEFRNIEENKKYIEIINKVFEKCFTEENVAKNIYVSVILTTPEEIKIINNKFRKIDKATDVLSFPMFEKNELNTIPKTGKYVLGDIVVSIEQTYKQAEEYEHSFEREFSYLLVHGFYHLMGYDHIKEADKKQMREKEENILKKINIASE